MHNDNMPTKNIVKTYAPNSFYHLYSRGINKDVIFKGEADYLFFISLFKRYLSTTPAMYPKHGKYKNFSKDIQLIAYCIMPNHLHLLIYQNTEKAMADLMRSIMTTYSKYFNLKYKHYGPVFQSRYLASMISKDAYLEHISRYIHLNPRQWRTYPYSSARYYLDSMPPEWLKINKVLELFNNNYREYETFLKDYEGQKQIMEELKWELANPN